MATAGWQPRANPATDAWVRRLLRVSAEGFEPTRALGRHTFRPNTADMANIDFSAPRNCPKRPLCPLPPREIPSRHKPTISPEIGHFARV